MVHKTRGYFEVQYTTLFCRPSEDSYLINNLAEMFAHFVKNFFCLFILLFVIKYISLLLYCFLASVLQVQKKLHNHTINYYEI